MSIMIYGSQLLATENAIFLEIHYIIQPFTNKFVDKSFFQTQKEAGLLT